MRNNKKQQTNHKEIIKTTHSMTRLIVHTHVAALFLFICLRVQKQERKHLPIHIFDSTLATRLGKRTDVSSEAVNGGSARRGNTAG